MLCRSFELPKAILLHYMSIWGGFSPSTATNLRRLLIIAIFIFSLFYSAFIIVSVEARFRHYRIRFMFVFATIIFLTIFLEKDLNALLLSGIQLTPTYLAVPREGPNG